MNEFDARTATKQYLYETRFKMKHIINNLIGTWKRKKLKFQKSSISVCKANNTDAIFVRDARLKIFEAHLLNNATVAIYIKYKPLGNI